MLCEVFMVAFSIISATAPASRPGDELIAIVNGKTITLGDIGYNSDAFLNSLHASDTNTTITLESRTSTELLQRVESEVRNLIIDDILKKYDVFVSPEEVKAYMLSVMEDANVSEEAIARIRKRSEALAKALEEWQRVPSSSDSVYLKYLKPLGVSEKEWETYKHYYATPQRLSELRSMIPTSLNDAIQKSGKDGYKRNLRIVNLEKRLIEEARPSDAQDFLSNWWKQEFDEANIEILNSRWNSIEVVPPRNDRSK